MKEPCKRMIKIGGDEIIYTEIITIFAADNASILGLTGFDSGQKW